MSLSELIGKDNKVKLESKTIHWRHVAGSKTIFRMLAEIGILSGAYHICFYKESEPLGLPNNSLYS